MGDVLKYYGVYRWGYTPGACPDEYIRHRSKADAVADVATWGADWAHAEVRHAKGVWS